MKKSILLVFVLFISLSGRDLYVDADRPNNDGDGESWDTAWKYISTAIGAPYSDVEVDVIHLRGVFTLADDNGDISIFNDHYYDSGLKIWNRSLTILGDEEDGSLTTIQAHEQPGIATHRIFYVSGNLDETVTFENLIIKNGRGEPAGGIYAEEIQRLEINNCIIENNSSWNDPSWFSVEYLKNKNGGGVSLWDVNEFTITNSIVRNNTAETISGVSGKGGGIFSNMYNGNLGSIFDVINCAFVNNTAINGGCISIFTNNQYATTIKLVNSTFSGNSGQYGSATYIRHLDEVKSVYATVNSCTFVDNYPDSIEETTYSILTEPISSTQTSGPIILDIKNSIVANYLKDESTGYENLNFNNSISEATFTRSYTISDDESMSLLLDEFGNNIHHNFNSTDPKLVTMRPDEGINYYKLLEGSPAKDAIPRGGDINNPFNGAGYFVVELDENGDPVEDENGNLIPTLDQFGNIQILDQRGFNFWNQDKDIGAYESPYYWVDVIAQEIYETIPNWKTELKIADPIEYAEDTEHIWTDYMRAQTGGRIILTENSEIYKDDSSELKWNDGSFLDVNATSRIINGLDIIDNASINIFDGAVFSLQQTKSSVPSGALFTFGNNSRLVLENDTEIVFEEGSDIGMGDGSEIIVKNKGTLIASNYTSDNVEFSALSEQWRGISCEVGSSIRFDDAKFAGALTAISGSPSKLSLRNCNFTDCVNGINFVYCDDYAIDNNTFAGTGSGIGVCLTTFNSLGSFKFNTIENFARGVLLTFSSPVMSKNIIRNNANYGLYVTGYTSYPQLINPSAVIRELNNQIQNNGLGTDYYESAQIYSKYSAAVYMENGMNNIHSGSFLVPPSVPCFRGVGYSPSTEIMRFPTILKAVNNYWGTLEINETNFDRYFDLYTWYRLSYEPYAIAPFENEVQSSSVYGSLSNEAKLLDQALKAEADGKTDLAIKKYERIIDKFPTSEENYVALSRLTDIYIQEEISLDPLITIYDAQIALDDESVNKHYFKEMKIASKIKTKKYDEAIAIAEEMKAEAQTEGEIILADIDISIANMLKGAENKGKGRSSSDSQSVIDLVNRLTDNESKADPAGITDNVLPTVSTLYQNYPNPFNPVTQIKFDLAKSANVKLSVYNVSGQLVAGLAKGVLNAGSHTVEFDGSKLNSGIYYYMLEVDGKNITKKMVMTK